MAKAGLIALIGPRGSGKSTVARLLAARIGWSSVDADHVLEQRADRSICDIIERDGERHFRELESIVLRELVRLRNHVIAAGGGIVIHEANRELLRDNAWVVRLTADVDTLWKRVESDREDADGRPPLRGGGREEIEELLRERAAFYRDCSHLTVTTVGRSPESVADEIAAAWRQMALAVNAQLK